MEFLEKIKEEVKERMTELIEKEISSIKLDLNFTLLEKFDN